MRQALEGLKALDFGSSLAGPMVGLYLAHHGATVIRVESTKHIDGSRLSLPHKDNIWGVNRTGVFASFNSGKLGIRLNLRHPRGLEVANRLIAWADVIGENFAPGVMARLGLGYEQLARINPGIIMYSSSNLGQTGPEAAHPGYGMQLAAYSGVTGLLGWPDREPAQPYGAYTDIPAPRLLVAAILAAVDYRRRTGKGQYLDMSQMEGTLHLIAPAILDSSVNGRARTRAGNSSRCAAPHGVYPCQGDDRWCAIAVFDDGEWAALCQAMGDPDWAKETRFASPADRQQNAAELDGRLAEWTRGLTAEQVMERLQAEGVAAGVVKNAEDIQNDPQLAHRGYFRPLQHPEMGEHVCDGAAGFVLSKTPGIIQSPAPLLGQHTEHVLKNILGMTHEEFTGLAELAVFE